MEYSKSWRNVFNAHQNTWGHGIGKPLRLAQQAGYPMIAWNGEVYEVPEDGVHAVMHPLFSVDELESPQNATRTIRM